MIAARLVSFLPLWLTSRLGWCLYIIVYYLAGYRKAVVYQNLYRAFPEKSAADITFLAKNVYRHLVQLVLELAATPRMPLAELQKRVRVINPELIEQLSENRSRSVIVLTIHQGNWEWMLHGLSAAIGTSIDPVYKPLHSARADRWIHEVRSQFGAKPLAMAKASAHIVRNRRKFYVFGMVADQSPIREERGIWRSFMNQDAKFFTGGQALAQAARSPVVFAQCKRIKRGYYELELHPIAEPPYDNDGNAIIDKYIDLAERAIVAQPETWLWTNRRWKRTRARDDYMDAWHAARRERESAASASSNDNQSKPED